MSIVANLLESVKSLDLERRLGLRPPFPPVVLQVDRESMTLVRLKSRRRALPQLEAVKTGPVDSERMPASIFDPHVSFAPDLPERLKSLFEQSGTRPGRISVVIPDNLAKITLLSLPERPASHLQMEELVRAQMRRSVPFRLEDARIAWDVVPGKGKAVTLLVVLLRRQIVEQCEQALEAAGAGLGLLDLATTNVINLSRAQLEQAAKTGRDTALLNCDRHYFSLAIFRDEQLIFFRCKTHPQSDGQGPNGALLREVNNSFSYYREKLHGAGVGTLLVRSVATPVDEIQSRLGTLDLDAIAPIEVGGAFEYGEGMTRLAEDEIQQIAPALGAAVGRA